MSNVVALFKEESKDDYIEPDGTVWKPVFIRYKLKDDRAASGEITFSVPFYLREIHSLDDILEQIAPVKYRRVYHKTALQGLVACAISGGVVGFLIGLIF